MTATSVTFNNATIAENAADGVIDDTNIGDAFASSFTDFVIEDFYLGEVRDTMGTLVFAGNQQNGFAALNTTLTGSPSSICSSTETASTASSSPAARSSRAW